MKWICRTAAVIMAMVGSGIASAVPYGAPPGYPPPVPGPAMSAPGYYGPGPARALPPGSRGATPVARLERGLEQLRNFLAGGSPNAVALEKFLEQNLARFFDFETMARWVAGPLYRQMNAQQKNHFQTRLQNLFFEALARQLGIYSRGLPRVVFDRPRRTGEREVVVRARVYPRNGYPVRLAFRFHYGRKGWRIYDVASNGQSAVSYYRGYFNRLVRQRGLAALSR